MQTNLLLYASDLYSKSAVICYAQISSTDKLDRYKSGNYDVELILESKVQVIMNDEKNQ